MKFAKSIALVIVLAFGVTDVQAKKNDSQADVEALAAWSAELVQTAALLGDIQLTAMDIVPQIAEFLIGNIDEAELQGQHEQLIAEIEGRLAETQAMVGQLAEKPVMQSDMMRDRQSNVDMQFEGLVSLQQLVADYVEESKGTYRNILVGEEDFELGIIENAMRGAVLLLEYEKTTLRQFMNATSMPTPAYYQQSSIYFSNSAAQAIMEAYVGRYFMGMGTADFTSKLASAQSSIAMAAAQVEQGRTLTGVQISQIEQSDAQQFGGRTQKKRILKAFETFYEAMDIEQDILNQMSGLVEAMETATDINAVEALYDETFTGFEELSQRRLDSQNKRLAIMSGQ